LFFLTACTNEYNVLSKAYYSLYEEIGKSADPYDVKITIEKFNKEEIAAKIEQLKEILISMEQVVPEEKISEYEEYYKWYQGLIIIKNSKQWADLTPKERASATTENALIRINLH